MPKIMPALLTSTLILAGPALAQFAEDESAVDGAGVPAPGQQMIQVPATNIEAVPPLRFDDRTSGTMTGTYDADDAVWQLDPPGADDLPATGWTETEDGIQVRLVGYPSASPDQLEGAVQVSFTLTGAPQELRAEDVRVTHDPIGEVPLLVAEGPNIDFNVTALERVEETLALSGDIVATVSPTPSGELTIDDATPIVIDGNFQATIMANNM